MTPISDFRTLPRTRLEQMAAAGNEIIECYRVLGKGGANVVGQVLAHQGTFYEMEHYPKGDVYDGETGAQYYYHAHRAETGEHGHFHTFVRAKGFPRPMTPAPYEGDWERPMDGDALAHLIAISMDREGFPIGLFTTNRWVTAETFYSAEDTIDLLDRFIIDHTYPCWATNRWLTAMVRLFRPQIESLLHARDRAIAAHATAHPGVDVYEDRSLEITAEIAIEVDDQIAAVADALAREGAPA